MNQKVAATVLLTVLVLSVCFVTLASTSDRPFFFSDVQNIDSLHPQLTAAASVMAGTNLHSNSTQPLDQPTRLEIYSYIKSNPGTHFRGICNSLGLPVGVVQYHLNVLERAGLVTVHVDGQNKRFFEQNNTYTKTDMQLISLMRHNTAGENSCNFSPNWLSNPQGHCIKSGHFVSGINLANESTQEDWAGQR